jgi:hypothetical protein
MISRFASSLPPLPDEWRLTAADRKAATALVLAAFLLTVHQYFRYPGSVSAYWGPSEWLRQWEWDPFWRMTWWATSAMLSYCLIPMLLIRFYWREKLADYGWKLRGIGRGWQLYLLFLVVMIPLVVICSAESRFRATYPFYHPRPGDYRAWVLWELMYAGQFIALEFFFRGFLIHALRPRFGVQAIFVSMVPYCMIHFGKPLPECLASIVAGIALGAMSYTTRSVGLGAALHIAVAWGMDFAVLARSGFFRP